VKHLKRLFVPLVTQGGGDARNSIIAWLSYETERRKQKSCKAEQCSPPDKTREGHTCPDEECWIEKEIIVSSANGIVCLERCGFSGLSKKTASVS
jgi:hypothetical protein